MFAESDLREFFACSSSVDNLVYSLVARLAWFYSEIERSKKVEQGGASNAGR